MRWFLRGLAALILIVWVTYVVSPYVAVYGLAAAVRSGDAAALEKHVNFRALRLSIIRQVLADLEALPPEAQSAARVAAAAVDPLLEGILDPEFLTRLMRGDPAGPPEGAAGPLAPTAKGLSRASLSELLAAAHWRGFRNVFFQLPPNRPPEARYRLQIRLGGLRWRVTALELPASVRARLVAEIRKRRFPSG